MNACFVNSDNPPLKVENICKYVSIEKDIVKIYALHSVDRLFYPHPDAPEHAIVSVIEDKVVKRVKEYDSDVSELILLYHAQNNLK
jgi:hypothetical protein